MDHDHSIRIALARRQQVRRSTDRRLIAVGAIRRHDGRTTTVRATLAGVTGSIRPAGGAR